MKIILLSDSHFKSIFKLDLSIYDVIIHCGDINSNDIDYLALEREVHAVRGNCDFNINLPLEEEFTINGKRFFICHSHLYNTKETYSTLIEKGQNYDFVIFGHTHIPYINKINNTYYINPGSFMEGKYMEINDNYLDQYENVNLFRKKDKYKHTKHMKLDL